MPAEGSGGGGESRRPGLLHGHHAARGPVELPDIEADAVVAVLGNPNVGKSTLFNRLTGLDVLTAHYPGKAPDVHVGATQLDSATMVLVDLPGAYALGGGADSHWVARTALFDIEPDVALVVVDETNMSRNLRFVLQVLETGYPTVVALNLHDEAERAGIVVDPVALTHELGVPAVPIVASSGLGVDALMELVVDVGRRGAGPAQPVRYGEWVEAAISAVERAIIPLAEKPFGLSARGVAIQLLEGFEDVAGAVSETEGGGSVAVVTSHARRTLGEATGQPPAIAIAAERQSAARAIAARVMTARSGRRSVAGRLLDVTTSAITGIPILLGVLLGVFGLLFFVGEALASAFSGAWGAWVSPLISAAVEATAGEGLLAKVLLWGADAGVEASLSIGLPYILTFYVLLGVLEDSGYLGSVAFLADRAMHRLGLHGRAVVPLVAAAGCNVPAVLSARTVQSEKERRITATLAAMVPCSAQTAVILGAVAHFVGWMPAAGVFLVALGVAGSAGVLLSRTSSGYTGGLVMEMFPFRKPAVRAVGRKAWGHFREFLTVAMPIVIVSSVVLGVLYETDTIWRLTGPLEPVVGGILGLPAVAGLTLLAGLVRKELALQLLVTLAVASMGSGAEQLTAFMTPTNLFVYALVNTVAFPCVSTIAVLWRSVGARYAVLAMVGTVSVAIALGGAFARILPALGWA